MGTEASQSGSPFVFPLVRRGKYKASFQGQIGHLKTKPCLWPDFLIRSEEIHLIELIAILLP